MSNESTGPKSDAADPLGPSIRVPEATGEPRLVGEQHDPEAPRPGDGPGTDRHAGNIREEQGTHAGGTVPAAYIGDDARDGAADPGAPEEALLDPDAADEEPGR